ncbi:rCG41580, isoform CRA_c [Rattus norvegicus]|uniref:RCG41580, isoform CRA_c n=1 Tax=Rattus norvegicus TaxID=10116 RepID=A6IHJ5_RAT|nr:rCG41580, isoform CRA_c [Rattus norvegicus]
MEFLILEILVPSLVTRVFFPSFAFFLFENRNSFYGRRLKSMEKLEILEMLFTLNA